jgi:ABC-type Co2+ transport system permease subunit
MSGHLFAVHLSDSVLQGSWLAGGFVVAAALVAVSLWRVRDDEIPQIALLTAAFFVASSIHIRIGPSSCHLLLNGLVGVVLGRRAALAIAVGLALQWFLLGHGGITTLGINTCVMLLPALAASSVFQVLRGANWLLRPWPRAALVASSAAGWLLSGVFSVALVVNNGLRTTGRPELEDALAFALHPAVLALAVAAGAAAAWLERRLRAPPEFALGLMIGEGTVLATVALHCGVLILGGTENWTTTALAVLVLHLPIAAVEGLVVGFLVGYLAQVKPALLGLPAARVGPRSAVDERANVRPGLPGAAGPAANGEPGPGPRDVRPVQGAAR